MEPEGGIGVLTIRGVTPRDVPFLRTWAPVSAWESLPPEERARTSTLRIQQYAQGVLGKAAMTPHLSTILIADLAGQPVGFALGSAGRDGTTAEWQGHMMDIFVLPPFRRRGIGRALGQALESHFARLGLRKVKMVGMVHNIPALTLAARTGYKPEGLIGLREW